MSSVWLVTKWASGEGGDDDRKVLAAFSDEEPAQKLARIVEGCEVLEVSLDPTLAELLGFDEDRG